MAATLASALLFAVMGVLVKLVSQRIPDHEIVFFRSIFPTLCLAPALYRQRAVLREHCSTLALRGLLGAIALVLYFMAIARIPYSNANLLCNLSPLFTAMLAAWFLHERLSPRVRYALPLTLLGVFLIIKPVASSIDVVGYVIGFLSGIFSGGACVTVRKLSKDVTSAVVVGVFSAVSVVVAVPLAVPVWRWPGPTDTALLLGVALTATLAQLLMTDGYRVLMAALAGTVGLSQVLMAVVLAVACLHETLDVWQGVGMLTVLGAVAWLTLEPVSRVSALPPGRTGLRPGY